MWSLGRSDWDEGVGGYVGEGWVYSMLIEESKVAIGRVSICREILMCDCLIIYCSISISVPILLTQI
jgi:hypothetical protein